MSHDPPVQPPPPGWWPPPPPVDDGYLWHPSPPPPPRTPPSHRPAAVVAGLAVALVSCGVGAAVGLGLRGTSPTASIPGRTQTVAPSLPAPSSPPLDTSSTGGTLDAATIAARVDPAIVDVTAKLSGQSSVAAGTGMILTSTGLVLTNNHVVEGSASLTVRIAGVGPAHPARVVGVDPADDVAVIQIENVSHLNTVNLGDSSRVGVGDPVVALGNALGREGVPTVTEGFVTGLDQSITAGDTTGNSEDLSGLIQVNALIQPGDSGGPLVNSAGHVIGMNTAAGGSRRALGGTTAFAIPSNTAASIAKQIQSGTGSDRIQIGQGALLGVQVATAPGPVAGAPVVGVSAGGPAHGAGIAAGDVIVAVGGRTVDSPAALSPAIRAHRPGDHVDVSWLDPGGQSHHATVQLIAGPPA